MSEKSLAEVEITQKVLEYVKRRAVGGENTKKRHSQGSEDASLSRRQQGLHDVVGSLVIGEHQRIK